MNAGPREWDAETYDRVSDPQHKWGLEVLDRLDLAGDETVMDAGCGCGRVTAQLLERLPEGRVIAVDASERWSRRRARTSATGPTTWSPTSPSSSSTSRST